MPHFNFSGAPNASTTTQMINNPTSDKGIRLRSLVIAAAANSDMFLEDGSGGTVIGRGFPMNANNGSIIPDNHRGWHNQTSDGNDLHFQVADNQSDLQMSGEYDLV